MNLLKTSGTLKHHRLLVMLTDIRALDPARFEKVFPSSFVGSKDNKQWIRLAIDADSREIVGVYVGDRSRQSAKKLWQSLPPVYRQCAVCSTDFWEAYEQVLPSKRHRAVGKETGKTNYIERFNNTLRQRVGRLVRKTLSFSKKLSNHIGAIWYFVHHYNASLQS